MPCKLYRALHKKVETEKLVFLQFATAAILSVISFFVFDFESIYEVQSLYGILPILYLGIFSTCIAFFIQIKAQKRLKSSKVAIILSTEAVFASILSFIFGYDALTLNIILGGLIVMISVYSNNQLKDLTSKMPRTIEDLQSLVRFGELK